MSTTSDSLDQKTGVKQALDRLKASLGKAETLKQIVLCAFGYALAVAVIVVEETLDERAKAMDERKACPECGSMLESRGFAPRRIACLIGTVAWRRRIWRCPKGCAIGQTAPFDEVLGIGPNQRTSEEIKEMACLLAVFVPYGIASILMTALSGVKVCSTSIWEWVQIYGNKAVSKLEGELKLLSEGQSPDKAEMDEKVSKLIMAVGGDGVMVPFRPNGGSPDGKAEWREVKVGIFARLGRKLTKKGREVKIVVRKRVVAVRGSIDDFKARMKLMSAREGLSECETAVWLSDGGKGFWRLFREAFSGTAVGVLDFYHAVQNVWKGAKAWLDGRTSAAREWFAEARRKIRQGEVSQVLRELKDELKLERLSPEQRRTLENLIAYLEAHEEHMDYGKFKALGLPIGSGIVESTCKWLIQERFKGVGMRWSEKGFRNLLHLRLEWVNEGFEDLFSTSPNS